MGSTEKRSKTDERGKVRGTLATCLPCRAWSSRGREVKTTMGAVKKLATSLLARRVAMAILLGLAEHLREVMRQGR